MKKNDEADVDYDIWICLECEGNPEFERPEMIKHMKDVHQIDPKTATGTRSMTAHIDARDWFQSNYEWVINGLKFANQIRCHRAKNDMMRWA